MGRGALEPSTERSWAVNCVQAEWSPWSQGVQALWEGAQARLGSGDEAEQAQGPGRGQEGAGAQKAFEARPPTDSGQRPGMGRPGRGWGDT